MGLFGNVDVNAAIIKRSNVLNKYTDQLIYYEGVV